ncbi:unnamed protein product [Clonostachys byssicola]|uniref:Uncharacterized protein n=1 Tax=Clonostachys byssicola TaxID=160290 RepID=A0A9N9UFL7_9HYPO|nr:unnamed protein product [Clonostachys byssicola]
MITLQARKLADGFDTSTRQLIHLDSPNALNLQQLVLIPIPNTSLDAPQHIQGGNNPSAIPPQSENIHQASKHAIENEEHLAPVAEKLLASSVGQFIRQRPALELDLYEKKGFMPRLRDILAQHVRYPRVLVDVAEEGPLGLLDWKRSIFCGGGAGGFEDGASVRAGADLQERLESFLGKLVSVLNLTELCRGFRLVGPGRLLSGFLHCRRHLFNRCGVLDSLPPRLGTALAQTGEGGTGVGNSAGDAAAANKGVLVGEVAALDGADGDFVGGAAEVDVVGDDVAGGVGVAEDDGALGVGELGGLNENLSAETGVDGVVDDALVQGVVDVDGAEADGGATRVDVGPVDVGVGDGQVALVLALVGVGVADQGGLPVVVDLGVGDSDIVGRVGDVEETVVVVLAGAQVAAEVDVVDPDVGGGINADGVTVRGLDLGDLEVADDDVLDLPDVESNALKRGTARGTDNGFVRRRADLAGASDGTGNDNHSRAIGLGSGAEGSKVADGGGGTAGTTGRATVGTGKTEAGGLGDGGTLLKAALVDLVDGRGGAGKSEAGQGGERSDLGELHVDCFNESGTGP